MSNDFGIKDRGPGLGLSSVIDFLLVLLVSLYPLSIYPTTLYVLRLHQRAPLLSGFQLEATNAKWVEVLISPTPFLLVTVGKGLVLTECQMSLSTNSSLFILVILCSCGPLSLELVSASYLDLYLVDFSTSWICLYK